MARIDPGLKRIVQYGMASRERGVAIPVARGLDTGATPNIMLELAGDEIPKPLLDLGFTLRTRAGRVLTGQIPREAVEQLEGVPGLKRAEAPRELLRELDHALPDARLFPVKGDPPSRRGEGVIIGIIDHGIDVRHRAFRNEDATGTTRILALWDQSLVPAAGEQSPPAGYGVGTTRDHINAALAPTPLTSVRHQDIHPFHGTHVAGIAAGGGQPPHPLIGARLFGVAPGAGLVVVANTRSRRADPGTVGDSADTLDAIAYILAVAKAHNRPVAINLSQGDNVGPHDGTSLLEAGIAELITGPGRVLIKSAGNEGGGASHAQGVLSAGGPQDVRITVPDGQFDFVLDLWYPHADRIALTVVPPGAASVGPFAPVVSTTVSLPNGNELFVDLELDDPGNRHNRVYVALQRGSASTLQAGTWTFRLTGSGAWHAWIQRNSGATFEPPFANAACTVTVPGTAASVITVGAHVSRGLLRHGKLSRTSSRGPTRAGLPVPTLTAPGEIIAPQPANEFVLQKGTSMAAGMVTGAAALMLAIDPTLTARDIQEILQATARKDLHTGLQAGNEWGHGKLDIREACAMVEMRLDREARRRARDTSGAPASVQG